MPNEKISIFGIGTTGLIGSQIIQVLAAKYDFINLSLENGVDITDPTTLTSLQNDIKHQIVIHLAAKADVDGCEKDKPFGKDGAAWKINVEGTRHVVDACKKHNKKLIYISTDFVFDGENTPVDGYSEEHEPRPINWYAETKYHGEKIVKNSGLSYLILRIAYPYRTPFPEKKDFVQAILARLKNKKKIMMVIDHIMTPTFVDDVAAALDRLIQHEARGIYHVVGSQFISPYDAALLIAKTFGQEHSFIQKTIRNVFFANCAPRPFNLSLNNAKIERLGVKMKTFEEGLKTLKMQMSND